MPARRNIWLWVSFGLLAALVFLFFILSKFYTEFLWFQSLAFSGVFIKSLVARLRLGTLVFAAVSIVLVASLLPVRMRRWPSLGLVGSGNTPSDTDGFLGMLGPLGQALEPIRVRRYFIAGAFAVALLMAVSLSGQWLVMERLLAAVPFGISDPVFNKDVGFYVFGLPAIELGYSLLMTTLFLATAAVTMLYVLNGSVSLSATGPDALPAAKAHISILAGLLFLAKAFGYRISLLQLLYSPVGVVYGPGYADVYAHSPAYKVLAIMAIAIGLLLLVNARWKRLSLIFMGVVTLVAASFLLGTVYPYFVQQFTVTPNEIVKETPFIANGIRFTRLAHDLDRIVEQDFDVRTDLTAADLAKPENQAIVENLRLWDYRPLRDTYSQLQEIRLYYNFADVDVDRYTVNGRYRQVMVAAREMNVDALTPTAKTWVNLHLKYTHGYGVVMSPGTEFTAEGLPLLWIKDIPPQSSIDIKVTRPEIYHGEMTNQYVIVKTKTSEFDYPIGDANATTTYAGTGGVQLSNPLKKLAFAIRLESYQMLLTDAITRDSRVMMYRNIAQRVATIAPFLTLDPDPYMVIGDDGRLFWIQDAYTTTNRYPYSQPLYGKLNLNYIRNAAKVVVDAYNGDVTFYLFDEQDPMAKAYRRIFPDLFKPYVEMRADLKRHIRYPSLMFEVQAYMYQTYHMQNPVVFYNKEDVWDIPRQGQVTAAPTATPAGGGVVLVEPQYTILRLPGEREAEFIQMLPFTPSNKNNMVAWLAARSDGEHYGQLVVFKFTKQQLAYGPTQIGARIDQDPQIAQSLTLWNQKDARTIRGNVMVIPIENSIMYVEPLYIQATGNKFPELKRVIIAYGDKVVMDETLERALERIFGSAPTLPIPGGEQPTGPAKPDKTTAELTGKARDLFAAAQKLIQQGDWAGYGRTIRELGQVLEELAARTRVP
jgi:uncharacterized membrane protein (UPF0182 family)